MIRRVGVLTTMVVLAVALCGFRSFTRVKNVCPKCPEGKADVVSMQSGLKVRCNVVAQNADYYVLERFGEYRAVPKTEVASVAWRSSDGGHAPPQDQVILNDGVVLHGRIVREVRGSFVMIQMGKWRHVAWRSQIKAIYKNGKKYTL